MNKGEWLEKLKAQGIVAGTPWLMYFQASAIGNPEAGCDGYDRILYAFPSGVLVAEVIDTQMGKHSVGLVSGEPDGLGGLADMIAEAVGDFPGYTPSVEEHYTDYTIRVRQDDEIMGCSYRIPRNSPPKPVLPENITNSRNRLSELFEGVEREDVGFQGSVQTVLYPSG